MRTLNVTNEIIKAFENDIDNEIILFEGEGTMNGLIPEINIEGLDCDLAYSVWVYRDSEGYAYVEFADCYIDAAFDEDGDKVEVEMDCEKINEHINACYRYKH